MIISRSPRLPPPTGGFDSAIEGLGPIVGIVGAPVDLVHNPPLGWRGKRGHGEVGVASEIAQQGDFAVEAAPLAIRARVVERPVAMDEAEDGAAVLLAKKAVVVGEASAEFGDFADEGVALLVVVMEMHFHVADAETHHFRDAVEQIAPVLLLRVEEAVLWALARGVSGSVVGNARPFVAPARHAAERGFNRSAHAQRFVVIGDGNPGTLRLRGPRAFPQAVLANTAQARFLRVEEASSLSLLRR